MIRSNCIRLGLPSNDSNCSSNSSSSKLNHPVQARQHLPPSGPSDPLVIPHLRQAQVAGAGRPHRRMQTQPSQTLPRLPRHLRLSIPRSHNQHQQPRLVRHGPRLRPAQSRIKLKFDLHRLSPRCHKYNPLLNLLLVHHHHHHNRHSHNRQYRKCHRRHPRQP